MPPGNILGDAQWGQRYMAAGLRAVTVRLEVEATGKAQSGGEPFRPANGTEVPVIAVPPEMRGDAAGHPHGRHHAHRLRRSVSSVIP
jgi:hypothetical protein